MKPDRPAKVALEALVAAGLRGDKECFESLLSIYRPAILRMCERRMEKRLRLVMEPEDVVQDVMLAAYRSITTVEIPTEAALRAWLAKIVHHRLISLYRSHFGPKRRAGEGRSLEEPIGTGSGSGAVRLGDAVPSPDHSPSSIAGRREQAEALEQVLSHLPLRHRVLIRMIWVEQLSIGEIATRLGRPAATVRKRFQRALGAARDRVVREGRIRSNGEKPA
ncbi:MAG: RNA polymerase sigma factor [Planctomycetes bacterium]|nr:RNA polymerase sigma factor [Planctomycetota bacterium]